MASEPKRGNAGTAVVDQPAASVVAPPVVPPEPPLGPPSAEPPRQPDARRRRELGEVRVEVANAKNRNVLFGPLGRTLRGRWDWQNLPRGTTSEAGLAGVPTIPGAEIRVSARERWIEVRDPLNDPQQAQTLRDAHTALQNVVKQNYTPFQNVRYEDVRDNNLATWLYWIWRHLHNRDFRLIAGPQLTLEMIVGAFPGVLVRRSFFDSLATRRNQQEVEVEEVQKDHEEGRVLYPMVGKPAV